MLNLLVTLNRPSPKRLCTKEIYVRIRRYCVFLSGSATLISGVVLPWRQLVGTELELEQEQEQGDKGDKVDQGDQGEEVGP